MDVCVCVCMSVSDGMGLGGGSPRMGGCSSLSVFLLPHVPVSDSALHACL